jgi:hypothetical protein
MAFDKYSKDMHELTAQHAGPAAAKATFWMIWIALWCAGLGIIFAAVILATKFLVSYVSALFFRVPLPQVGNVVLSFVMAVAVVGFAGVWFFKTFKRARDAVSNAFATQVQELRMDVNALRHATDSRVMELVEFYGKTLDRVLYLESHAASIRSTNNAVQRLHERIVPLERHAPELVEHGDIEGALLRLLMNAPSADSVGHPLEIHEATYGVDGGAHIDVRAVLDGSIKDNRIRMPVTNDSMGRDPQWGAPKRLRVRYSCGDRRYEISVNEGEDLRIPD